MPSQIASGNNHLLYFVNASLWRNLLSRLGVEASDPFTFLRLTQWMNAFAAAGSVSILWMLCNRITDRIGIAIAAAAAYAFANAFILHATSTAEPMVGLLWSFVSVGFVAWGLSARSRLLLLAGGAFLLLAMATYESMVLIGPAELTLIHWWDEKSPREYRLAWFLSGCIVGGLLAYAPIYYLTGTADPLTMWRRFAAIGGGEQVYGGVRIAKIVNLPFGFTNSIFGALPPDYGGIRSLRAESGQAVLIALIAVVTSSLWFAWTIVRAGRGWLELRRNQRLVLICCAAALIVDSFALIYWDPMYDKLWLQPLAAVTIGWSVIYTAWRRREHRWQTLIPEALAAALIVTFGFARAVKAHRTPTPCLGAARQLSTMLGSSDLLVHSWDPISTLYIAFWDKGTNFDVPGVAVVNGYRTTTLMKDFINQTRADRYRIYFLGILDEPESTWEPFLGDRCHIPFHAIDDLRECAKPVATLTCDKGDEVLWELAPVCNGTR